MIPCCGAGVEEAKIGLPMRSSSSFTGGRMYERYDRWSRSGRQVHIRQAHRNTGTVYVPKYQSTKNTSSPSHSNSSSLPLLVLYSLYQVYHTYLLRQFDSTGPVNVMLSDFEVPEVGVECSRTCRYHEGTSPSPSHPPIPSLPIPPHPPFPRPPPSRA